MTKQLPEHMPSQKVLIRKRDFQDHNDLGVVYNLRVVEWVALIRFLFGVCHY